MKKTAPLSSSAKRVLQRAEIYAAFAVAFEPPPGRPFAARPLGQRLSAYFSRPVHPLPEWQGDERSREHRRIFGHGLSPDCPPYETFYGPAHIFRQSQELADISGFYAAWGLEVSEKAHERADHVSLELEFMAYLAVKEAHALAKGEKDKAGLCREAHTKFLAEHLGRWIAAFAARLKAKAPESLYARLAGTLKDFLKEECRALGARPALFEAPGDLPEEELSPECLSCGGPGGPPSCGPSGDALGRMGGGPGGPPSCGPSGDALGRMGAGPAKEVGA